ncbi:MAG: protein-methionine-sulfoxide reductase catalytic subunit MsrP [Janthinobacterium lividum]
MLIRVARGWELPESAATPETAMLARRTALGAGLAGAMALGLAGRARAADATTVAEDPAVNPAFVAGRATTPEDAATTYNNFYEFGEDKSISRAAQKLPLAPWTVSIDGLVEAPMTLGLDDLLRRMPLEQRVYRHRCVEAWAMTVPWTGFPLAELVKLARPLSSAKFVTFTTAELPKVMPGLRQSFYPWPYTEGVTMAEATNPLPFLVTGMYGKPLPPQNGGPFRLALPWKYGFKSAKSIVKVSFTDTEPHTFWEAINPDEYGFWANVNPAVPHPRWSQASERLIGSDNRVPTQLYNGYGEFVASLYPDTTTRKYFM